MFKKCIGIVATLFLFLTELSVIGQKTNIAPVITWGEPVISETVSNERQVIIKTGIESKFDLQNVEVQVNDAMRC
jgi:hypothetical protein